MQSCSESFGNEIVAFAEPVSLGFATIGVVETLGSVGGQVLENVIHSIIHQPRPVTAMR
jgi:hypothetical protein